MDANGNRANRLARLAGLFYLLLILVGIPGMGMFPRLVVGGDAATTAANLVANETMVRLAFAGYLLSTAGYLVVMGLFYSLFRPVNREVAFIAVLFSLVGCTVGALSMLFVNGSLMVLGAPHPAGLGPGASRDLALLLTEFFFLTFSISMIFFGLQCILTGWLVYLSGLLPRPIGIALAVGGFGYLTYLLPPLAQYLFPINVLPGYAAELAIMLWLLLKGVDSERWAERARPTGQRRGAEAVDRAR